MWVQKQRRLYALFDSGANLSCISPEYAIELGITVNLGRERKIATASEGHYIIIKEKILLDFCIEDILLSDEFLVVPGLSEEVIIGAATLQKMAHQVRF